MSEQERFNLRIAIRSKAACAAPLAAKDCEQLAKIMSVGRTRSNHREIGNGTVLEVLGFATGNALLDDIDSDPTLRHVKPLLEQGRLLIGADLVQAFLRSKVGTILTQAQADALCALGKEPYPYTAQEISEAMFNPDGSEK